jgi:hypothetical protein
MTKSELTQTKMEGQPEDDLWPAHNLGAPTNQADYVRKKDPMNMGSTDDDQLFALANVPHQLES